MSGEQVRRQLKETEVPEALEPVSNRTELIKLPDRERQLELMTEAAGHDLKGCTQLIFNDFPQEISYFERVTLPEIEEARAFLSDELCIPLEDIELSEIHMIWVTRADGGTIDEDPWVDLDGFEYTEGWLECTAETPGAVPFWKDNPYY